MRKNFCNFEDVIFKFEFASLLQSKHFYLSHKIRIINGISKKDRQNKYFALYLQYRKQVHNNHTMHKEEEEEEELFPI